MPQCLFSQGEVVREREPHGLVGDKVHQCPLVELTTPPPPPAPLPRALCVIGYGVKFVDMLPVKYIVLQARADQARYGNVLPKLLSLTISKHEHVLSTRSMLRSFEYVRRLVFGTWRLGGALAQASLQTAEQESSQHAGSDGKKLRIHLQNVARGLLKLGRLQKLMGEWWVDQRPVCLLKVGPKFPALEVNYSLS